MIDLRRPDVRLKLMADEVERLMVELNNEIEPCTKQELGRAWGALRSAGAMVFAQTRPYHHEKDIGRGWQTPGQMGVPV